MDQLDVIRFLSSVDLEQQITSLGIRTVVIASVILVVCTIIALLRKNKLGNLKLPLFIGMAGSMLVTTVVLFGGTIYLNMKSESGGPVHWHSEIEFWACGTEIELRNPTGFLSNKIGTATYHEHNDKHIHLEGVVVDKEEDASLTKFMRVTGGYVQPGAIAIPLDKDESEWFSKEDKIDGDPQGALTADQIRSYVKQTEKGPVLELANGQSCGRQPMELQVFVYSFDKKAKTYSQRKLADPGEYVMRDESSLGPPSDCVIVEFDAPKNRTDKLCQQYGIRDVNRCQAFGVKEYTPDLCNIREVTTGGNR